MLHTYVAFVSSLPGIAAIGLINEALDEGDLQKTMAALQNPAAKLTDIDPSLAQHYYNIFMLGHSHCFHPLISDSGFCLVYLFPSLFKH
uniref:Uncharacterized protein n=1 Tax=Sinocyclocheilus grahami TaxID=75366 RepID=A0A672K7N1_SINGR